MNKKILLISGCPRSGTTLINIIINSHPKIAITNEINLFNIVNDIDNALFRREGKLEKMIASGRGIDRKKTSREIWKASELLDWIPRKKVCKNEILYQLCSSIKSSEITIYGDKTPGYYHNNISLMAKKLDLDIYMIHISRDPFEVVSSIDRRIKNSQQDKDYWRSIMSIKDAVNEWIDAWNSRKLLSNSDGVKLLDMNYNALIKNPKNGTEIISEFLSVENKFNTSMVNNSELKHDINSSTITDIAPQLQDIMSEWHKYGILLNNSYELIPRVKDSYADKARKNIKKIVVRLNRIILCLQS